MGTVAVSAFEPFGGRATNRSLEVLRRLERLLPLQPHVLPVDFARLPRAVRAIAGTRPPLWVLLGESGVASALRFEARAWNRIDARLSDNGGHQPRGMAVARGPQVRRTSLAVKELSAAARSAGARATPSLNAGRFACNAAYYLALAVLGSERVLFVHVPTDRAVGSDAVLARGLAAAIGAAQRAAEGGSWR